MSATASSKPGVAAPAPGQSPATGGRKGYSIVNDAFGMLGLHNTLQANDADPGMILMTRGFDLHTLGLPLAQQEPFHPTFSSPWSDQQIKVQPDYRLPQCYFVNPPHLKFAMFQKFTLHTLFYVFYSMPRDVLQLAAAQELHNREWWFHKGERLWMSRTADAEHVKGKDSERGPYQFFNPTKWALERRDDFVLYYNMMEERAEGGGAPRSPAPQGAVPPGPPTR
jgi:CCR4-NOT transcription complex subunit 2